MILGPSVTHVIAGNKGTEKEKWAKAQSKVYAVNPEWLDAVEVPKLNPNPHIDDDLSSL